MSIEQEKVIDILSDGKKRNEVILFITDHLPWDNQFTDEHLIMLEKKINTYLSFIESGEFNEKYPQHKGKLIIITVLGKYPLSDKASQFYEKASYVVANVGFLLRFEHA